MCSESSPITSRVDGMSCGHRKVAVTDRIQKVDGVTAVDVDLRAELVRVAGAALDAEALAAAIDEAGYDAVRT